MLLGAITAVSLVLAVIFCISTGGFGGFTWLWLLPVGFAGCWLAFALLAFLFLLFLCSLVDLEKPQEKDSKFYRAVMYLYIEALMTLVLLKVETKGLEKTPADGRFLLVCNHQNESDPGILLHYFKKSHMRFISKRENANMVVIGKMMHKIRCPLINRENDREALKTILECIRMIKDNEASIGAFPEGGIKVEGKLSHFRSGMFKIAQKANVPIVVCTLKGTHELFHNLKRLKKTQVRLHLVDVIPAEELKGYTAVEIGDRVYQMMLEDLGPEYKIEGTENT